MKMEKRDEENKKYYYVAKINLTTGGNYGYSFRVMPQNEMLLDSENMDLVKWIEKQRKNIALFFFEYSKIMEKVFTNNKKYNII